MKFVWPDSVRADLRAVDRVTAIRILHALTEFGESGNGDIKPLVAEWSQYTRLRVGDYRVIMLVEPEQITIFRVRHRSEVYR
jgi:mRNA-degrading endonuclease RelE of RelBE toxin-antitoxin system